jgi:surface antigen
MSSARFVKALLAPAAIAAAIGAPLLGASPAAASGCAKDPVNGACVAPVYYKVVSSVSKLAVQKTAATGNILRYVSGGATVSIVCQVNNGGTADGKTSKTWAALSGGGWVYNPYLATPAVGADGFSAGIRHCGATTTTSTTTTTSAPVATTTTPVVTAPTYNAGNYPWQAQDGWVSDGHGYWQGECVSFVAWAVRTDGRPHTKSPDKLGNASAWTGAYVDATPHVGDAAQWDSNTHGAGSAGHIAYVTAVNSDGTITVNEYNWGNFHRLNVRSFVPGSAYSANRYLHF